jgi:ubiquinone/menaquinone biosynthesis C-methylase UbiE
MTSWYQDFFTELPNAFWRAAVPAEQTEAEVDFIVAATRLPPGARVLDVACGSGRHALALARRGFDVTGLDVSEEAITFARSAADAEGLAVDFHVADMQRLSVVLAEASFSAVVCMGNAFGYLEHDDTRAFLADVAGRLAPGGSLVVDTGFVAESLLPGLQIEEPPMTIGGVEATSLNEYDVEHSRWVTSFVFRRGAEEHGLEEHRGTSIQHVYTSAELGRLMREAGFRGVRRYGDPDGSPYTFGWWRLLLVADR